MPAHAVALVRHSVLRLSHCVTRVPHRRRRDVGRAHCCTVLPGGCVKMCACNVLQRNRLQAARPSCSAAKGVETIRTATARFQAVTAFDERYVELKASARERLGSLYAESDYPASLVRAMPLFVVEAVGDQMKIPLDSVRLIR